MTDPDHIDIDAVFAEADAEKQTQAITRHESQPLAKPAPEVDGLWRYAQFIHKSGLYSKGFKNPESVLVAISHGQALGFTPAQAVHAIHVIDGKPSLAGKAALAKIRGSGQVVKWDEQWIGDPGSDDRAFSLTVTRLQQSPDGKWRESTVVRSYSMREAKAAKLAGKDNWQKFPDRMLMWRVIGFVAADLFPDMICGLYITEELDDGGFGEGQPQGFGKAAAAALAAEAGE